MRWLGLFAGAALATAAAAQENADPYVDWSAEQWRQAAYYDVLAAYRIYVDNHPGIYDLSNPEFPTTLAKARADGLKAAAQATDRRGYGFAMATFSRHLADGHAKLVVPGAPSSEDTKRYWPGFVALWRGDEMKVLPKASASDLAGATITACEGKPVRDFISDAMLYRDFRPTEEGQWWLRPSQPFYSVGNPAPEQPQTCTFKLADGSEQPRELDWQEVSDEDREFYVQGLLGSETPIGLTEPKPGIFLIGLQTFSPGDEDRASYAKLYEELETRRDELLKAKAIVLDMRRNGGGSSNWSKQLASVLWGEEALESRGHEIVGIDWRASEGNIAYLAEAEKMFRDRGQADVADWIANAHAGMVGAHEKGEPLWREEDEEEEAAEESAEAPSGPVESDFNVPVYVINWGLCASACLNANDYFKRFDNVKLIGAPTSADSTYMEVRDAALPHGPGRIVIPNKVWVGRKRGWGEIYEPDILMTDTDWSTENFLNRIEQDLAEQ